VNGGPMYTWSDQFDSGFTVDMLSTPGGAFVCILAFLVVIGGIALQRSAARKIDDWIDTLP